jgi:multimeric flavodoxin WrbA
MQQVYEALVFWADVIVLATPIRWGNASSLFYKMAERMNCIQNQITINDRVLIRNKVATFIITGGQDNIQGVAGQLLTFFSEVGFHFPQFPFIAHSRGWDAEDMERNMEEVEKSEDLREGARQLVTRGVAMATLLLGLGAGVESTPRGGRKASPLRMAK